MSLRDGEEDVFLEGNEEREHLNFQYNTVTVLPHGEDMGSKGLYWCHKILVSEGINIALQFDFTAQ